MNFLKYRNKKGFTLIEMLVVVAIIGLLSSILLIALGPARDKAKDSRIIQEVNQVRSLAETTFNITYSIDNVPPGGDLTGVSNQDLVQLATDINNTGGGLILAKSSNNKNFVVFSKLNTQVPDSSTGALTTQYYCVDSSGQALFLTTPPDYDSIVNGAAPASCH